MTAKSEPATWKILPTNSGHFQWAVTVGDAGFLSEEPPETLTPVVDENPRSHLPSMSDILLQYEQSTYSYTKKPFLDQHVAAPSKLGGFGGDSGGGGGGAMFRTGLGRKLSVRKNSIQKARSLLEGDDVADKGNGGSECFPMFRTGLGKSVQVSHSSIKKAAALLEVTNDKEGNTMCNDALSEPSVHVVQDNLCTFPPLNFNTAGGRCISISSGSLKHAGSLRNESTSKCCEHLLDQVDANILLEQKKKDNKLLMDMNPRNGDAFGGDHIATLQNYPHVHLKGFCLPGNSACKDAVPDYSMHELQDTMSTFPPLKFSTAAGRSVSVSADALKLARSLLNDLEFEALDNDAKANEFTYSTFEKEKISNKAPCNIKSISFDISHDGSYMNRNVSEIPSSMKPIVHPKQLCSPLIASTSHYVVSDQVHANECSQQDVPHSNNNVYFSKFPNEDIHIAHRKVPCSRKIPRSRSAGGPLVDITNCNGLSFPNKSWYIGEKKRPGGVTSGSSFKRPRTARLTVPPKSSSPTLAATADLLSTSVNCCSRTRVSTRYPFQSRRKKLKEFFGGPPGRFTALEHLPDRVRYMTADNAEKFRFHDTSYADFGPEAFQDMLLKSGASLLYTSEKWVANHYKWIVWKLACLERCYPSVLIGRLLTVSNVLEELKYRYEREFNYGHRSALKKILDGDVSSSSMMILCVSAIRSCSGLGANEMLGSSKLHEDWKKPICDESSHSVKIELTDGWYSLNATLDVHLSKQLLAGKLFVGQKLRVWGATLCGWVGPISPLEESNTVSLFLYINGTYRAHWAESLGFCKGLGAPLAFRCIKVGGGKVSRTYVGITRLYPILYKERLQDGCSIVRSENMEKKVLQFYSQRRSDIAEDIISEIDDAPVNVNDSEEGSKILKILESSSEPEVLMAGLSSEQLISFSNYQAKQEALRQANLHKKIEKALEEAGLGSRDVTPFMRVRVVGLISTGSSRKDRPREGLITIWNPTEKQKLDLVEGHIYSVSGLAPHGGGSDFLRLQSRGCSSSWNLLSSKDYKKFEPFFVPRKSVLLSNLGEVPLASEFDIAALVVLVGEVHISGSQRRQWIFVTDGSACNSSSLTEDQHDVLLAISFRLPIFGNDLLAPISQCLSGNIVGFCNLIKRAKDWNKNIWVAEATENSTYSVCHNISCGSHLKEAANSASTWGKSSSFAILKLKERVLRITGGLGM